MNSRPYRVVVTATIEYDEEVDGFVGSTTRQLPTFFLDPDVQGIMNAKHAERIVRDLIDPFPDTLLVPARKNNITYHVVVSRESETNPSPPASY